MTERAELQQQLRERARELVPVLRERAAQCESERVVPEATIQDFKDAGFFRILQPARWGGYELDPQDFYDVQMTLAEGCMSSAWVLGVVAIHNWQLALFDDRAAQDVWGDDTGVLISSSYMPVGKVEWVGDDLKLSGQWGFSSGCDHCEWVFLGAVVPPKPGTEAGAPDMRTFLLPRSDYEIVDDWHVMGLKGTGSKTIVVKDAIVPEYRTHKGTDGFTCENPGNAVNTAPLFKLPFGQVFVRAVSSSAIGALQGAVDVFVEKTSKRVGKNDGKTAGEDAFAQFALAKATATVDELKLVLHRNFDQLMAGVRGEREVASIEDRVKMRNDSAAVLQKCVEGVDDLFAFAGGTGIYEGNDLLRIFLDIHAGRAHTANNPYKFGKNQGAVQLGIANGDFFI
jgi:3-hydroxy-9,10-secoandrosta-1,3,5(10)-triene-9,17-dione monooxygenase